MGSEISHTLNENLTRGVDASGMIAAAGVIAPLDLEEEVELAVPGGIPREGGSRAFVGGGLSLMAFAFAINSSFARSSSDV